ncbi:sce7726 family protein [Pseudomonas sp. JV449]|uniref:sce7726 family protein n=1 Tax=Pseudomonas sp. JV449 TaxID=1890658 RepID=UPI0028E16C02|nr:sce7726 family protein [Pseudomonas sp. JV449]MDT9630036.1 sce7726 family protein [Pseudomonas sp. JV449]
MKELEIKRALLEHLINDSTTEAISTEFPFHFGRRRADLICVQEGEVFGYEIKSAYDRIDRLPVQLESYEQLFDYVYVVCDKKHLASIRKLAPEKVGIYICSEEGVRRVRAARLIRKFDTLITLDALPIESLRKEFKLSGKSKFELCTKIKSAHKKENIKKAFRKYIVDRYGSRTITFQNEITAIVTLDDVFSLSLPANKLGA